VKQNSKFNLSIHGLRGFAAISILIIHVHGMGAKDSVLWTQIAELKALGPLFVCIFFCISGFLIAQTLEKHNSLRIFAENRLIRIYPLFLILHLVMFVLGPVTGYSWMGDLKYGSMEYLQAFGANLFFLPGIFHLPIAQKNAWSLSFEALFYILAGIVWQTSTMFPGAVKNFWLMVQALVVASIVYNRNDAAFFFIGVACYLIKKNYDQQLLTTYQLGIPALVIAGIAFLYNHLLAFPFLSIFFFEIVQEEGLAAQLLRTRPLRFLGTISYSLYLIHPFVMDLVRMIAVKAAHQNLLTGDLTLIILGPTLSILVAWISYEFIEGKLTKSIITRLDLASARSV
jgi:peptidoglycan/LPS O-acetylase OafA/YrhL